MKLALPLLGGLLLAATLASTANSQDNNNRAIKAAISARQSHMVLNSFNLGLLGSMAKGQIDYDADAAAAAAGNLAALAQMDESRYWPAGSDMETLGIDSTEALATIWTEGDEFALRAQALSTAATQMAEVAGTGLAPMRSAIGPVAKACSGCHEDFRADD